MSDDELYKVKLSDCMVENPGTWQAVIKKKGAGNEEDQQAEN